MDRFGFLDSTKLFPENDFEHPNLFSLNECPQEEEETAPENKRRRCDETEEQRESAESEMVLHDLPPVMETDCVCPVEPRTNGGEICAHHPEDSPPALSGCTAMEPMSGKALCFPLPKEVPALVIPEVQVTYRKPFCVLLYVSQAWLAATGTTKAEVERAVRAAECHYDSRAGGPLSGRVDFCAQCAGEAPQTASEPRAPLVAVDLSAEQAARNPLVLGGVLLFVFDRCRAGCRASRVHLRQPLVLLAQLPRHALWAQDAGLPGGVLVSNAFVTVPRANARKTARRWRLQGGRGGASSAGATAVSCGRQWCGGTGGIDASAEEVELAKRVHWAREEERAREEAAQAASRWVRREAVDAHRTYTSEGTFVRRGGGAPGGAATGVVEEFTLAPAQGDTAAGSRDEVRVCRGAPPSARVLALQYAAMPPITGAEYLESSPDAGWCCWPPETERVEQQEEEEEDDGAP